MEINLKKDTVYGTEKIVHKLLRRGDVQLTDHLGNVMNSDDISEHAKGLFAKRSESDLQSKPKVHYTTSEITQIGIRDDDIFFGTQNNSIKDTDIIWFQLKNGSFINEEVRQNALINGIKIIKKNHFNITKSINNGLVFDLSFDIFVENI